MKKMDSLYDSETLLKDTNEAVSLLCYITQISERDLNQKEFENATKICYYSLRSIFPEDDFMNTILTCLNTIKISLQLEIHKYVKLFIRNKHSFQLILLCSLKHYQELFQVKKSNIQKEKIQEILPYFFKLLLPNNPHCVNGVKLLEMLVKKRKDILERTIVLDLIKFVNFIGISQIEGFKYHGQNLAKTILKTTTDIQEFKEILSYKTIPIRGIPTQVLAPIIHDIRSNGQIVELVEKIIQMFSNNIESREAGFLYNALMFQSFDRWKENVWPIFARKLAKINQEGEFFKSLLKYWVPISISTYKSEFYRFINNQETDNLLKAHILLETRKKSFYEENLNTNLPEMFCAKNTSNIALKIICTFHKKTINPSLQEIELLKNYLLYSFDEDYLDTDQLKSLTRFFSQIFLTSHEYLTKNENYEFHDYKEFLDAVFNYCVKCLESNRREVGSQILSVIWDIALGSSDRLSLSYKLEKGHGYDTFENKFFQQCTGSFGNYCEELLDVVNNIFEKNHNKLGNNFSKLISERYYDIDVNIENSFLFKIIEENTNLASIECVDNIKNCTSILTARNNYKKQKELLIKLLDKVQKDIDKIVDSNSNAIFKIVLHLEVLNVIPDDIKLVQTLTICGVIEQCLCLINLLLEREKTNNDLKTQKVFEAFINITLVLLSHEKTSFYEFLNKQTILHQMRKIITTSNMKKPTTLAADVIKVVGKSMSQSELEKDQKLQFLAKVLSGLYEIPTCQNLTIRKSPETRLVLHGLCLTDQHEAKPLIHWTLDYILNILSDPTVTHSTISSALYCAEALIADNTMYSHTFCYVSQFIMCCIGLFERQNWVVRNAVLQLTKVIIDRFLGVLIGESNRQRSIEDLFLLFPELASEFYKIVSKDNLKDSAIIVFQFFIESQFKKQVFKYEFLEIVREGFFHAFWKIINEDSGHFGTFSVRALVSMCTEENIPFIFSDILSCLNVEHIRARNTLKNFVLLFEGLHTKYKTYSDKYSEARFNLKVMEKTYDKYFISCLNQTTQFDLLLVKVLPQISVINELISRNLNNSNFEDRIWQHNYLPSLIKNSKSKNVPFWLNKILLDQNNKISDFVQIQILSILIDKFNQNTLEQNLTLAVLFEKLILIDDSNNYLLLYYLKLILLLVENKSDFNIPKNELECIARSMRLNYEKVRNVYKSISFSIIVSQISDKTKDDQFFIKNSIKCLHSCNFENEDLREIVSQSLIYFYRMSTCDCQKYEILKISLIILLNYGLYNFIALHKKIKISSTTVALVKLFEIAHSLGDTYFYHFVHYAYSFLKQDRELYKNKKFLQDCKTYFPEQNLAYIDKHLISKVVLYFLRTKRKI